MQAAQKEPTQQFFLYLVTSTKPWRLAIETMNFESFETRVLPTKNKLFRFAFRLLGSQEEARDVVQEVMIKVWNGREQWATIDNMEAWCMRITKNLSLDRLRSKQRKITDPMEDGFEIRQEGLTPLERTELDESMVQINQLMTALPDKQRQVMHLRDIEGYSYNEICEILELDMNQVKVNLFRARNAVREKLVKLNAYGLS
jgi:RNA polymerase sigma factor (sigma-70 family)